MGVLVTIADYPPNSDNYFETEDRLPPMPKVEKVSKFAEKGIGETYEADNNV